MHGILTSDLRFQVEDQIAEGERVATRWSVTMSLSAGLLNVPTTGQEIRVTGISIHRFADGRVTESWDNWDALTLYQALGADVFESVSVGF